MKGLLGIHITPPERAVEPPIRSVFSRMSTLLPEDRSTSPAHMEPPPLPATTKSKTSSNPPMPFLPAFVWPLRSARNAGRRKPLLLFGRQPEYLAQHLGRMRPQ